MSIKQIRRFFITIILTIMLAITIAFDFGTTDSWAANLPSNQANAMTKNVEGKAQEALGNLTGDPKDQIMGKIKQVQSQELNAVEDLQDKMELKGRAKAVSKNLEGKTQEAIGDLTNSPKDQVIGRGKQVESQGRNIIEDMKDKVQDIFN
jgi:uncharacterized protein YjbJ (UPF0337 family)